MKRRCAAYRIAEVESGYHREWSFTPLRGKRPYLPSWQARPRETLRQAISWARCGNVGLRCGRVSSVLVLDVDTQELPVELAGIMTPTVRTGSGKFHLYCRAPEQSGCPDLLLPNGRHIGEVKGDGGQVVFVGSIHPDTGEAYDWLPGLSPVDVPTAEVPSWVFDRSWESAQRFKPQTLIPRRGSVRSLFEAASAYAAKVPGAGEGSRHTTAVNLVAHLSGFESARSGRRLHSDEVRTLLHQWNAMNTPPLRAREIDDLVAWINNQQRASAGPVHLVREETKMQIRIRVARRDHRRRLAERSRRGSTRRRT